MIRRLYVIFFFVLVLITYLTAGTTGKIVGSVTDSETGEPLVGVNVYIENTVLGAATDISGIYVINNINPGTYVVFCETVGFAKQKVTNVEVNSDFTTKLNFVLRLEVMEGEVVVVEAERPMIRKDLTSSQTSVNAGEIEALPVENVSQLLTLQAGITEGASGELHIRGGRSSEVSYNVNGVSVSNPYDNSRSVNVATNAIQELSVVSGTFNAEYGNALSGIVNTITKEGGQQFTGSFSAYTGDYFSNRDNVFANIDDLDPLASYVTEFTVSGPIPIWENKITFFTSARFDDSEGYLSGVRQHRTSDLINTSDPNNFIIPATGDFKNIAMNSSKDVSATGKITIKPNNSLKLNYDVVYNTSEWQSYNHDLKYNPDANYNRFEWGLLNSIEIKHVLSPSIFYTLRGSYNINDFKRYLFPLLDEDGNSVKNYHPGLDYRNYSADSRYMPASHIQTTAGSFTFNNGGTQNEHFYQRSKSTSVKFDITNQMNKQHEVKLGLEGKYHQIDYEFFDIQRESLDELPFIADIDGIFHNRYSLKPVEFSAYIQDKMEFDDIVLNVGLRFDYIDSKSRFSTDIFNPTPSDPDLLPSINKDALLETAKPKSRLSPRVGVSFPISESGVVHFSYGHFYQIPPFRFLYTNSDFKYSPGIQTYGNANLNPEKTVTYELGLQQQLTDNIAMNITGFFKDVRDLLALQRIRINTSKVYNKYVNKDYASIKGVTFSLIKQRNTNQMLRASLDYTFQVSEGNDTDPNDNFFDLLSGRTSEKIPVSLDWDQTHTLTSSISIGRTKDWNVSLIGKFGTGLPYTPELFTNQVILRANSERKPTTLSFDLLADKVINLSGVDFTVFVKIYNLLDRLNERFVYNSSGTADYSLDETRSSAKATDERANQYNEIKTVEEYFNNPAFYRAPRQVQFGMSVNF